jgi:hypothetical protein
MDSDRQHPNAERDEMVRWIRWDGQDAESGKTGEGGVGVLMVVKSLFLTINFG